MSGRFVPVLMVVVCMIAILAFSAVLVAGVTSYQTPAPIAVPTRSAPIQVLHATSTQMVTLADSDRKRYARVRFILVVDGQASRVEEYRKVSDDITRELRNHQGQINVQIEQAVGSQTASSFQTLTGQEKFKGDLKSRINAALGQELVTNIVISELTLQ